MLVCITNALYEFLYAMMLLVEAYKLDLKTCGTDAYKSFLACSLDACIKAWK